MPLSPASVLPNPKISRQRQWKYLTPVQEPARLLPAHRRNPYPARIRFLSVEDFHATLLHEAIHGAGHPKRLARLHLDSRMGSVERAREELVAELGAALTLASIGLPPSPTCMESHAAYIASWLEVLRKDKQEIFRAAAQAQKACDYLQVKALKADMGLARVKNVSFEAVPDEPRPAKALKM